MEWWLVLLLLFGLSVLFIFAGFPVGISFLFANLIGTIVFMGGLSGVKLLILNIEESVTSFTLLTVPMFVLMGEIMFHSGMAYRAIDALDHWIGRLPGRLALLAIVAGVIFGAISGSTIATTAMFGATLIPEMKKRGYKDEMAIGPILGSGALDMLIPPSILAVVLATLVEVPVGHMLIAGIVPGLMLASFYFVYILIRCWFRPEIAPPYDMPFVPLRKKLKDGVMYVLPLGIIIFSVLGVIFLGVATPSEAAALGVVVTFILSVIYGGINWEVFKKCLYGTIRTTTFMFVIIMASLVFSQIFAFSGSSRGLIGAVIELKVPPLFILILMQLTLILLGCFMDNLSIAVIATPIFMPLLRVLGFDPLWVATMTLVNIDVGNLTPPFGLQLFVMKGVQPDVPMSTIIRAAIPFVLFEILTIILIMIFPSIALYLPTLMRKG
jgi:tripartite ATP-independent transporter DctM subunit